MISANPTYITESDIESALKINPNEGDLQNSFVTDGKYLYYVCGDKTSQRIRMLSKEERFQNLFEIAKAMGTTKDALLSHMLKQNKDVDYQNIPWNGFDTKSEVDEWWQDKTKSTIFNVYDEYYGIAELIESITIVKQKKLNQCVPQVETLCHPMKTVIVINGKGGVGKDTLVAQACAKYRINNVSTIDPIKAAAKKFGWNNDKTAAGRKLLSDIKTAVVQYNNFPTKYAIQKYQEFMKSDAEIMFVHIREAEEIEKFMQEVPEAITLLVKSSRAKTDYGNHADDEVEKYDYDYTFFNDTPLDVSTKNFLMLLDHIRKTQKNEKGNNHDDKQ